jgi:hypothetical protein
MQTGLDELLSAFELHLSDAARQCVRQALGLSEAETPTRDQLSSMEAAARKRVTEAKKHVGVRKANGYAFIQWEPEYTRTKEEEAAWKLA